MTYLGLRLALSVILGARLRSFLTMFGVIIGVASVITVISLAMGIQQQIVKSVGAGAANSLTIVPQSAVGSQSAQDFMAPPVADNGFLSEADLLVAAKTKDATVVVPFASVPATPEAAGRSYDRGVIVATSFNAPTILNQKVSYGAFFAEQDSDEPVAVIGQKVAAELFGEVAPVGQTLNIRGQAYTVRGVMEAMRTTPFSPYGDYKYAIFIPYNAAKALVGGQLPLQRIVVQPATAGQLSQVASALEANFTTAHGGKSDVAVLRQQDTLRITSTQFVQLAAFVTAIACVSLLMGGIGIMNVMLVTVSERTHEIGIRKAIGATNRQILAQFMAEGIVLSTLGGIMGIILSLVANYLFRVLTPLEPALSWQVSLLALGVASAVGVIFSVAPAMKAARKDPITALRR